MGTSVEKLMSLSGEWCGFPEFEYSLEVWRYTCGLVMPLHILEILPDNLLTQAQAAHHLHHLDCGVNGSKYMLIQKAHIQDNEVVSQEILCEHQMNLLEEGI